jgi:receptor-type tyrosine-protein phosphatase gamma
LVNLNLFNNTLKINCSINIENRYCEATGNTGSIMSYTWFINGSKILNTTGRLRADGQILRITSVQKSDSGMYQCAALNTQNSIIRYSTAELRVIEFAPTFIKRPMQSSARAAINGNVTIVCDPEGAPKPSIQWYLNSMPIGNSGRQRVLQNGNLMITQVNKMDEGNYTCDASNRIGRESGSTYLFVVDGTSIDRPIDANIIANINQTFFLPCTAYKVNI